MNCDICGQVHLDDCLRGLVKTYLTKLDPDNQLELTNQSMVKKSVNIKLDQEEHHDPYHHHHNRFVTNAGTSAEYSNLRSQSDAQVFCRTPGSGFLSGLNPLHQHRHDHDHQHHLDHDHCHNNVFHPPEGEQIEAASKNWPSPLFCLEARSISPSWQIAMHSYHHRFLNDGCGEKMIILQQEQLN